MLAVLKDGRKEFVQNLSDCLFIIENYLGCEIAEFIQEEFNEIESDNNILKEGLNDINTEFKKLASVKNTLEEEQQELLEDLGKEIKNNIWW